MNLFLRPDEVAREARPCPERCGSTAVAVARAEIPTP